MSTEKIKIIYDNNKKSGNVDLLTPILFISLIISVFSYYYTSIQKKLLNTEWEEKKCSPRYVFFSGFLNPLDKNPLSTTQSNFQKCVANNIYKDPELSKDIKTNKYYIRKNEDEIQENLKRSKAITQNIRNQWNAVLDMKQDKLTSIDVDNQGIVQKQGTLYVSVAEKSTQLFNVLKSILYYLKNTLIFKANFYKKELAVDSTHERFMERYTSIYNTLYVHAFNNLNSRNYTQAMNQGRDAIEEYKKLTKDLDEYIEKSFPMIAPITETCYKLRYSVNDSTCNKLFPNLNEIFVDMYPTYADMLNKSSQSI